MKFTIGTDPEFFLKYRGKFVASQPFLGDRKNGTKYNPIKMKCGATVQRDNVAIEFATTPSSSLSGFKKSIHAAMNEVKSMLPKEVELAAVPSVVFTQDQLDHPEALEFGCDPDYNAWTMTENHKPCAVNQNLRSAGAHVHVGHKILLDPLNKIKMIRLMDCFLGLSFTVLDCSLEALKRKELYGKAGAYRPTPYGVEYRTLSNFWLSEDRFIEFVYISVEAALSSIRYEPFAIDYAGGGNRVQEIINSGNSKRAKQWYNKLIKDFYIQGVEELEIAWRKLNV